VGKYSFVGKLANLLRVRLATLLVNAGIFSFTEKLGPRFERDDRHRPTEISELFAHGKIGPFLSGESGLDLLESTKIFVHGFSAPGP
jgi:hypothetical protein